MALVIAALVALFISLVGSAPDTDLPGVTNAVTSTTAPPTNTGETADTVAGDLAPTRPRAEVTVAPATALAALDTVRLEADDPFLTRPDAGFGLCAVEADRACTLVPAVDHHVLGGRFGIVLTLPRRFTTWTGDVHDCATDSPCEVRVWAFDDVIIERSVPVTFTDAAPDGPSPVGIEPSRIDGDQGDITVAGPATADVTVLQCVRDRNNACAKKESLLVAVDGAVDGSITVTRRIFTPRGPHDCTEETCELRFVRADGAYSTPTPISFPAENRAAPRIVVRPNRALTHGSPIEILTPGQPDGSASHSLCIPDQALCTALGTAPATGPLTVRIPRWLEDRRTPTRHFDCALTTCVLRTVVDGTLIDTPLVFVADNAQRPPVTVVISRRLAETVVPGDTIALSARGLFLRSTGEPSVSLIVLRFCETTTSARSGCVTAVGNDTTIDPNGTLETRIVIPDFDRRRTRIGPDGVRTPFCSESCWIIVEPQIAVPGGTIRIDITTSSTTDP